MSNPVDEAIRERLSREPDEILRELVKCLPSDNVLRREATRILDARADERAADVCRKALTFLARADKG
jgi:hypothetical protein